MSEEQPAPPPVPPAPPGFIVEQVDDGTWTMSAKGDNPWFVAGFETVQHAHGWILDYLTTNIENSNRIHVESLERKVETDLQFKHALTESLMYSEAASKERKRH